MLNTTVKLVKKIATVFFFSCCTLFAYSDLDDRQVSEVSIIPHTPSEKVTIDTKAIINKIKTKAGEKFSQNIFDADLKQLAGEFDRVEPELKRSGSEITITIHVYPKPRIRHIKWEGNNKIETKKLLKELGMGERGYFNKEKFAGGFNKIKAYYLKKGYFDVEANYQIQTVPGLNEVDVAIQIKEGNAGFIKEINFTGLSSSEQSSLLAIMATQSYNFFTSWFTGAGTLNPEAIDRDRMIIIEHLQNKGFSDASVEISTESKGNELTINIDVDKGEKYYIDDIRIHGNRLFNEETLRKQLKIKKDEPYSPDALRASVKSLSHMYGSKGYIETAVNYQPSLQDAESRRYDIDFYVEESEQYRVGLIKVYGNMTTKSRVILHECLLIPGEVFDSRKLEASEARLMNTGYFKSVNVFAVKTNDTELLGKNHRDVHIEVEETDTARFNFSFGLSTLDRGFVDLGLEEKNFNYKGIPYLFSKGPHALRGNGQFASLKLHFARTNNSQTLSWTEPYFKDSLWSIGFDAESSANRTISHGYSIESNEFGLFATYPFNSFLKFKWNYHLKDARSKIAPNKSLELTQAAASPGTISSMGVGLMYDSTDHSIKARKGFRSELSTSVAGLGGTQNFVAFNYLNTFYHPPSNRGVIKLRADLRFLVPYSDTSFDKLPLSERLFTGGDGSVRGYRPFHIGPKFVSDQEPKGGLSSTVLSAEYMHKIFAPIDLFVFTDAGQISEKTFHSSILRWSYGWGLRIEAMQKMPIYLGWGIPVNADKKIDERRFFFNVGGRF